jgi:putative salt-induced outer membrane protein
MSAVPLLRTLAVMACLIVSVPPAMAQWSGKGQAGAVMASGNSAAKSGSVKLGIAAVVQAWTHKLDLAAVYASDEGGPTAQRWEVHEQSNYEFDAHNFVFGGLRYENDRFSGFNHQGTVGAGIGHQFLETAATTLSGQLGVAYKVAEEGEPPVQASALASTGSADFRHAFSASTTVLDKITLEHTPRNTFVENEVTLEVKMNAKLALAVAFAVRHNTDPPPTFKATDTLTTVNVVYEIK